MSFVGLKGSANARDLGGAVCQGGVLRPKLLLRSGNLHRLTPRDIAVLRNDYNLKLVVDLRTDTERAKKPDVAIPGAEYASIPLFCESTVGITHERQSIRALRSVDVASRLPDMEALYRSMVTGDHMESLARAVRLIVNQSDGSGAIIYHCTEGKDRTGVISLVLLSLLGVGSDDIFADYLSTNEVARRRARRYRRMFHLLTGDRIAAAKIEEVFLADASYLMAAQTAIKESYGSFDAYARQGLGINDEMRAAFCRHVLF